MPRTAPYCPDCGHLDGVRKVSAIYDGETRYAATPYGPSFSSTPLADRLAPPDLPEPRRLRFAGCVVNTLLGLVFACSVVFVALSLWINRGSWWYLVAPLSLWLAGNGVLLLLGLWLRRRHAVQLASWEAEVAAWNQRSYGARCDDTFVPPPPAATRSYTGRTIRIAP